LHYWENLEREQVGKDARTVEGYLEVLVFTRCEDELEDRTAEAKARGRLWAGDLVDELGPT
jgi:hypothetical protein